MSVISLMFKEKWLLQKHFRKIIFGIFLLLPLGYFLLLENNVTDIHIVHLFERVMFEKNLSAWKHFLQANHQTATIQNMSELYQCNHKYNYSHFSYNIDILYNFGKKTWFNLSSLWQKLAYLWALFSLMAKHVITPV